MNRRTFLATTRWAALATGSIGLVDTDSLLAEPRTLVKKTTVGGHLWVYAAKQPGFDATPVLDQVFADMAYAGLDGVELMHQVLRLPSSVNRVNELKQKHKIGVLGTSYGANFWDKSQHNQILEDAEQVITRLAKVGGRTFGTSVGSAPAPKTPEQLDAQAELLKKVMVLCQKNKISLNIHNHTYEVANNQHDLKGILARIPGIKLGPDLNWLVRGGVDPVQFISEYGNRIVFMHIRDQAKNGRWSESVGEGDMDFKAIGEALKKVNFTGDAVIELAHEGDFTPTRPLKESWKMSREFVRKTMGF